MIVLYITCKDKEEAKKISKHLLEKKLIACSNIIPIESMYWWKGKIEECNEYAIIAKTKEENYGPAEQEIKKIHSYQIPCILKIKVGCNKEYGQWVEKAC